jgi:hypothetical protein
MGQVEQDLDALGYDVMTFMAADAGDKSDTAGIMFVRGIV